jgi:hypothetical protein
MNQPVKAQEPSMEEILASIRRIISDDDGGAKPVTPVAPPPKAVQPASPPRPAAALPPAVPANARATPQREVDAVFASPPPPAPGPAEADLPDADVLDLTEAMAVPEPAEEQPGFRTIDGQSDVVFADAEPAPPQPAPDPVAEARRQFAQAGLDGPLMSSRAATAVDSAFNSLAQTVLVQNSRTLEDLVREMLRPMLKAWLDDNLPGLVERLVRAEIERVSRGR